MVTSGGFARLPGPHDTRPPADRVGAEVLQPQTSRDTTPKVPSSDSLERKIERTSPGQWSGLRVPTLCLQTVRSVVHRDPVGCSKHSPVAPTRDGGDVPTSLRAPVLEGFPVRPVPGHARSHPGRLGVKGADILPCLHKCHPQRPLRRRPNPTTEPRGTRGSSSVPEGTDREHGVECRSRNVVVPSGQAGGDGGTGVEERDSVPRSDQDLHRRVRTEPGPCAPGREEGVDSRCREMVSSVTVGGAGNHPVVVATREGSETETVCLVVGARMSSVVSDKQLPYLPVADCSTQSTSAPSLYSRSSGPAALFGPGRDGSPRT